MEKIIKDLINKKEEYSQDIEAIIFDAMNYENTDRELNKTEIKAINKARRKIYAIYKAIEILDDNNIK